MSAKCRNNQTRLITLTTKRSGRTVVRLKPSSIGLAPLRFLRSRRNQPMLPHRFIAPLASMVRELAEVAEGIARELDDPRWKKAADALTNAAELLRDASR